MAVSVAHALHEQFGFASGAEVEKQSLGVGGVEASGMGGAKLQAGTAFDAIFGSADGNAFRRKGDDSGGAYLYAGAATGTLVGEGNRGCRCGSPFDFVGAIASHGGQ